MMFNRKAFFDAVRGPLFDGSFKAHQVAGLDRYLNAWENTYTSVSDAQFAYVLATVYHETGIIRTDPDTKRKYMDRTMSPVEEVGKGRGRSYGLKNRKTGQTYYGRGDVQLTWLYNYEKAGQKLGIDLVNNPALALDPSIAVSITFVGMIEGWFTGGKLRTYINPAKNDFLNARRIINGVDRAALVAGYAETFLDAIKAARKAAQD